MDGTGSGKLDEGFPAFGALMAAHHGKGLPMAFVTNGFYDDTAGTAPRTRVGNVNAFQRIADYNAILPNSALINRDKEKHFGLDALFTYMLNPGTALHIGYTDLYDNLRLDPLESPALVRTDYPDLNTGRQLFIKLGYLLRF